MRYALVGGKRVRPVICLATTEAAGADRGARACRRPPRSSSCTRSRSSTTTCRRSTTTRSGAGRPVDLGAASARRSRILAGDALLAEAFRLALSYPIAEVGRELAQATLGMIGGQYLDITGTAPDEATLHRLKTGCLFAASVGYGALGGARCPSASRPPWRAFGDELGLLFQIVDDILDGDGYVACARREQARASLRTKPPLRARERLAAVPADTSTLVDIVDGLATRTS